MINTKYLLYISTCLLVSGNVQASNFKLTYDSSDIFSHGSALHTQLHTPNELKPISLSNPDNSIKLVAVCSVGGGGCNNLTFGSSGNSMNLDGDTQCTDDGYVKTCPEGQVPDENNRCPHNKSYFKCRDANTSCDDGYSKSACNSTTQVQIASYTNEAGSTCYQCRDKTCAEGGYTASLNSCQNGTAVSFANQTCYKDVTAKTCEDIGFQSSVANNEKCEDQIEPCGLSCYQNCYYPTCENEYLLSECPDNHSCSEVTSYGKTCYKDNGQPSCSDGGYKNDIPTNNVCTQVDYYGNKCFNNCYQPTCDNGGYLNAQPAGQTCTPIAYYGRNCFQNDCKNVTLVTPLPILYSDMTVDDKIISGKTPIGIVFDDTNGIALSLHQSSGTLKFSENESDVSGLATCVDPYSCGTDGKTNTAMIIKAGNPDNYPAANYCHNYFSDGTEGGDWHLPSVVEMDGIYSQKNKINETLTLLGKALLTDDYYWTSTTQAKLSDVYEFNMEGNYENTFSPTQSNYVRPVIYYGNHKQRCDAIYADAKKVTTEAELIAADAYDAKIVLLNDITVTSNITFRAKTITWPWAETCALYYSNRPTLKINNFNATESTTHQIDVNLEAQTVNLPDGAMMTFGGKLTATNLNVNASMIDFLGDVEVGTWTQKVPITGVTVDGSGWDVNRPYLGGDNSKVSTININNYVKNTSAVGFGSGWSIDNSNITIPASLYENMNGELALQCKANIEVQGSTSYCADIRIYSLGDDECSSQFTINGKTILGDDCSSGMPGCSRGIYTAY